ncbi:MAG: hypothetical protein GOVbin2917_115 [Prokaryotic dsDNA virus sp.]|nr:MAG: hypothetical protein GOVbin2917_115 [Prokaryotic dsDNA virus sp.]
MVCYMHIIINGTFYAIAYSMPTIIRDTLSKVCAIVVYEYTVLYRLFSYIVFLNRYIGNELS